jgi:hypothetical protein
MISHLVEAWAEGKEIVGMVGKRRPGRFNWRNERELIAMTVALVAHIQRRTAPAPHSVRPAQFANHGCVPQIGRLRWGPDKLADMSDDTGPTTVYFACPKCSLPCQTTQVRRPERVSGSIHCLRCGGPVHRWTGFYDFISWRPVRPNPRDGPPKGTRGPRH